MRGARQRRRVVLSTALALGVAATTTGCQSAGGSRRVALAPEPALSGPVEPGAAIVEAPVRPSSAVTFMDRHPLFSKPRDLYESSGNNKVVKAAAATVIGIPAGIYGELKQIVVGTPESPKY